MTETWLPTNLYKMLASARTLQDAGFALAINDFVTGYASIRSLCELPFSELKID